MAWSAIRSTLSASPVTALDRPSGKQYPLRKRRHTHAAFWGARSIPGLASVVKAAVVWSMPVLARAGGSRPPQESRQRAHKSRPHRRSACPSGSSGRLVSRYAVSWPMSSGMRGSWARLSGACTRHHKFYASMGELAKSPDCKSGAPSLVPGSNPGWRTNFKAGLAQMAERVVSNYEVDGSIPSFRSNT